MAGRIKTFTVPVNDLLGLDGDVAQRGSSEGGQHKEILCQYSILTR